MGLDFLLDSMVITVLFWFNTAIILIIAVIVLKFFWSFFGIGPREKEDGEID